MATKPEDMTKDELIAEVKQLRNRKKYGLVWEDKPEAVVEACSQKLPVLTQVESKTILSGNSDITNILIEGDNYHALSVLNYTHKEKVDVIYIDPPYNTGKMDFVYNDHYVDKEDSYRHSKWLSFMDKRLRLAKQILKKTGVIIAHIDENEESALHLLLKEIFGEQNDLGKIIWNKKNPKGDSRGVAIMHETILCFAKNKDDFMGLENVFMQKKANVEILLRKAKSLFSKIGKTTIPEEIKNVIKPFDYSKSILDDFKVTYDLGLVNKEYQSWLQQQDFSGGEKAYRFINEEGNVYQSVSMAWPNKKKAPHDYCIPLIHPITKKKCPVPERGWRYPSKTINSLLKRNLIIFGKDETTQPREKYFLKDYVYQNTPSIFSDGTSNDELFKEMNILFDYPKPWVVSKYLLSSIHPSPKLIVDFFAGSGTTAHAILALNKEDGGNRQFILCTNNENRIAETVTYPRIKNIIKGYAATEAIPANLRYFKTDFVEKAKASDDTRYELVTKSSEMICVRENTFNIKYDNKNYKIYYNNKRASGILFNLNSIDEFKEKLVNFNMPAHLYIFSLSKDTFDEDFLDLSISYKLIPIPESILEVYRKIFRKSRKSCN